MTGSGPGGRISLEDVKRHARELGTGPAPAGALRAPKLPDFSRFGPVERKPMPTVRKHIAEAMALAWNTVPHVSLQAKADITELESFRQKYKGKAEATGGKLTLTAILLKVSAAALRAFPAANVSADLAHQELVLKRYYNIGFAADTPRGLLVPVVREVDKKSLVEIAVELAQLSAKARDGKLSPAELEGGCFTVSNLGAMGIGHFTAIVNAPEVALLSVGKAVTEPVWDGSQFRPRLMLPLAINVDHRVLDGADGARLLSWIVQAIEQPLLLALEG